MNALLLALALAATPAEKRDVVPVAPDAELTFQGLGRDEAERRRLDELAEAYRAYAREAAEYRDEVTARVESAYREKRDALAQGYERQLGDLENLERKDRLDAIARFETFLRRYPNDPAHSPDAMFRLAELLYERASDDHEQRLREWQRTLEALAPDDPQRGAAEPAADYRAPIALYQALLGRFPGYRFNDAAIYLRGYCEEKQGDFARAAESYRELVRRYPRSRFVTEAWVRIGEHHFDDTSDPHALDQAAAAYQAALVDPTHPLYDKALYKLGWTHYRLDHLDAAIERFLQLVDFYEARPNQGADLRDEALEYAAISFADPTRGSLRQVEETFARLGRRSYEGELYRRLGEVLFDQTRNAEAIAAFRRALERDPLARTAPETIQKIAQAYERDQQREQAYAEAEQVIALLSPTHPWAVKWRDEPAVLEGARTIAERLVFAAAIHRHQQALADKAAAPDRAQAGFEAAARGYQAYLARFPTHRHAYEAAFYLAECLYNRGRFPEAAERYAEVRDSPADARFLTDAAYAAVLSLDRALERARLDGSLSEAKPRRAAERPGEAPKPVPLAPLEQRFVAASDAFSNRLPNDPRAPGIAYKAAELLYARDQLPEARERFERLSTRWPRSDVAPFAVNWLVESHLLTQDWERVEALSAEIAADSGRVAPGTPLQQELLRFKLAARFKRAEELLGEKRYPEAAAKFLSLVEESPRHEFADRALHNAAVALESSGKFDAALALYERISREFPGSSIADAALFRVAVNAENVYDFERAAFTYERLVKDYPRSKDRGAALYNQARLFEALGRREDAAAALVAYAELVPAEAAASRLRAARLLEGEGKNAKALEVLAAVRAVPTELEAPLALEEAKLRRAEGDLRRARLGLTRAAEAKGMQTPAALDAAAEARFLLAELEFEAFDALKLGGRGAALEQSFKAKRAAVKKVNEAYAKVFAHQRLEWTLAALYRRGNALERFASTIIETPVPAEVKRLGEGAVVAYQDLLAQQTSSLEDAAVESYAATWAEASRTGVDDVWTRKTLAALHRFRPSEYPLPRPARSAWLLAVGPGPVDAREAKRRLAANPRDVEAILALAQAELAAGQPPARAAGARERDRGAPRRGAAVERARGGAARGGRAGGAGEPRARGEAAAVARDRPEQPRRRAARGARAGPGARGAHRGDPARPGARPGAAQPRQRRAGTRRRRRGEGRLRARARALSSAHPRPPRPRAAPPRAGAPGARAARPPGDRRLAPRGGARGAPGRRRARRLAQPRPGGRSSARRSGRPRSRARLSSRARRSDRVRARAQPPALRLAGVPREAPQGDPARRAHGRGANPEAAGVLHPPPAEPLVRAAPAAAELREEDRAADEAGAVLAGHARLEPSSVLRVGVLRDGRILEERQLAGLGPATVGTEPGCTLRLSGEDGPGALPLFQGLRDRVELHFGPALEGRVLLDGEELTLEELRHDRRVRAIDQGHALELGQTTRGAIELAGHTVFFQFVPAPRPPAELPSRWVGWGADRPFAATLAICCALLLSSAGWVWSQPRPPEPEIPIDAQPDRFARLFEGALPKPVEPEPAAAEDDKDEGAEKGAARAERAAEKAKPTPRRELEQKVASKGLLKVLAGIGAQEGGAAFADLIGSAAETPDLDAALANAKGVGLAARDPLDGRSRQGTAGEVAGIGALGTRGGTDVELGPKSEVAVRGTVQDLGPEVESGEVDRDAIAQYVRARLRAIQGCYERELKKLPKLRGKVSVRFVISPSGRASEIALDENTVGSDAVGACVRTVIRGWAFPFHPREGVEVSYPFVFSPASGP